MLVVDDDGQGRALLARLLGGAGYEVATASNGRDALDLLTGNSFDVIVSDISMPEMTGVELLRSIREHDSDVPVILVTGLPDVKSAMQAVSLGAFHYATKPIDGEEMRGVVAKAARLRRIARLKQEALTLLAGGGLGGADRLGLEASCDRAFESLWMAFQPIVRANGQLFGYEALLRSNEPSLPHPGAVLDAAERLERLDELGRLIRGAVVAPLASAPPDAVLFVNLHARDLRDETLYLETAPLSAIAERVVLEITERAALEDVGEVRKQVAKLRSLGFRVAVDDLGAGYAGLTSFITLEPEIVKLDMTLVRGVDTDTTKQKLVRSVTALCKDLGMLVVAEGIETRTERDAVIEMGCDLLQGYNLARPDRPFPAFSW